MSRAFGEDQDGLSAEPERIISAHPNDVTEEGFNQIEAKLAAAREAYAAAQASDDHPGMTAASRELRYWNARRATARIVPNSHDATQVRFGSTVTIVRDDGREQTFRIVGEDEANPARGTISHVSPLARSMFGKCVGDVVPAGSGNAEILSISSGAAR
jgi:transcription elongation GreA/GreB family factor